MEKIMVSKKQLLKTLKNNRTNHKRIFEDAMIGFRKAVVKELTTALKQAKNGGKLILKVNLIHPISFEEDYNKAIGLLELCVSETVDIDEIDYRNYILDDWGWKSTFSSASSSYSSVSSSS